MWQAELLLSVQCNAWHWTDIKSKPFEHVFVCLSVRLPEIPIVYDIHRAFCPTFLKLGHTCDNEDQV